MPTRIELTGPADRPRWSLRQGALIPRRLATPEPAHRVTLVAGQALLLTGDQVRVEVVVDGPHELHVVETSGTVAYDMRGGRATWELDLTLTGGARVVWHAEPFVVAAGADVVRTTRARLDETSRLAWRERVVLGRTGETGGRLLAGTQVDQGGRPVLVEDLDLSPALRRGRVVLGEHRCLDTITTVGQRLPDGPGVLQAEAEASLARWFGHDLHRSPLEAWWVDAARVFVGQGMQESARSPTGVPPGERAFGCIPC